MTYLCIINACLLAKESNNKITLFLEFSMQNYKKNNSFDFLLLKNNKTTSWENDRVTLKNKSNDLFQYNNG